VNIHEERAGTVCAVGVLSDDMCGFSDEYIPLATTDNSATADTYLHKGDGMAPLDIFLISGNSWSVEFDTNLGDLEALQIDTSDISGQSVKVEPTELITGTLPLQSEITVL